jgi:hypothetical protein
LVFSPVPAVERLTPQGAQLHALRRMMTEDCQRFNNLLKDKEKPVNYYTVNFEIASKIYKTEPQPPE